MPTRDWRPVTFSICVSSMSSACTSAAVSTFGQHQLVEPLRRALDDLDHVAVRPLGVPRVHAHAQDGLAPVELLIALTILSRARRLLERRDRVLEVEEHHVGAEARAPWRASSRSSPGPRDTSGEAGCDCVLTWREGYRAVHGGDPNPHPARARRRRVGVAAAGRRVGREQRRRDRRRRRPHRDRHADGALAVGAVRRRGRPARPAGRPARAHARARRPRRRHRGVPDGDGARLAADERAARRRDAARRVQGVHARVRRGVRRARRARHPAGHPPRHRRRASSRRASRCCPRPATPRAT